MFEFYIVTAVLLAASAALGILLAVCLGSAAKSATSALPRTAPAGSPRTPGG